ncbi:MAG: Hsp20/alpha crystallin family protein [Nitrososphaeraceae archaeon]|nr:Hsp20/alpha crystallin family protein [Nitrososphaeraceae archaeon]MBV9669115.1 Hsp20/alpha crystallin family protein [Nitrososphaeraceae archaeon]
MSFGNNVEPEDWFTRFFGSSRRGGGRRTDDWFGNTFAGFEKMFEEQLEDMQTKAPKELVREYETPEGGKVREIGPIVYGYSATIGPDGKPRVAHFGNVKSLSSSSDSGWRITPAGPQITAEIEPLVDMITSDKEVKVIVELPGVNKENIKVNAYDNSVEISANTSDRKYRRIVDLPPEADTQVAKCNYKNGILEIVFNKKQESKPKGKEISIE